MICHVTLPVGKRQKVLLVPKDALVLGGATPRLIVVETATDPISKQAVSTGKPVAVEMGASFGDMIQISGQVKAGTLIVIRGNERLMPGQPLNVVKEE